MIYSLFSIPTNEFVRMDSVSPVVPGLSGSKNKSTTSARFAYLNSMKVVVIHGKRTIEVTYVTNHFTTLAKS